MRASPESSTRRRFGQLVARDEAQLDLAEAALLIAAEEYPDLNVGRYLERIDEMGARARDLVPQADSLAVRLSAFNRYLFAQEGFRGNSAEYYDPRNSFLNDVLDRKMGIPISLSAVYIEVGRRAGLLVDGVGFPGHFLVKAQDEEGEIVADPFHGGTLLSAKDCQKRLDRVYGGKVKLEAQMLAAVGPRQMLTRMLRNLKAIYVKAEDYSRGLKALELLLLLDAENPEDLRDRGLVYAALDCYASAAKDLEAYLSLNPKAPEADKLALKIAEMERRAARLH